MRRMRGAAIVVTAVAIGRALVAFVGLTLIGTKLAPCFGFAGTSVMPAFHVFHLSPRTQLQTGMVSGKCKSTAIPLFHLRHNSGPPLADHCRRIAMTKLETLDNLVK